MHTAAGTTVAMFFMRLIEPELSAKKSSCRPNLGTPLGWREEEVLALRVLQTNKQEAWKWPGSQWTIYPIYTNFQASKIE